MLFIAAPALANCGLLNVSKVRLANHGGVMVYNPGLEGLHKLQFGSLDAAVISRFRKTQK